MGTCVYINLPAAEDRRRGVEASFAAAGTAGWTLRRFEALGPADVADLAGALSPTEAACFASHRAALAATLDEGAPVLIVEDDTTFAPQTFGVLDALFAQNSAWDVIYTDVALCDLALMLELARRRDAMVAGGQFLTLDVAGRSYWGASAYAVRGSAKRRLHAALSGPDALSRPIDLLLRDLAQGGEFRMGVCFPFLTSPAASAGSSQIQPDAATVFDGTLNAFRRLMAVSRDVDQCRADAQQLTALATDETARLTGAVFAAMASPAFPMDR
jgi:GR25 family glycosyltransferase involved in LPS biosynthesis